MKYIEIALEIIRFIENGELNTNDKLPSESAQSKLYGVSINTIKKAMEYLIQHGYIRVINQSGYYVNHPIIRSGFGQLDISSLHHNHEEHQIHNEVYDFAIVQADKNLADKLLIDEGTNLYKFIRGRFIKGELYTLQEVYLPRRLFRDFDVFAASGSLYQFVEQRYNIYHSVKSISASLLPDIAYNYCKEYLHDEQNLILKIENIGFLDSGIPFEYSINYLFEEEIKFTSTRKNR